MPALKPTKPPHPMFLEHIRRNYTYNPDTGIICKDDKPVGTRRKGDSAVYIMLCISSPDHISIWCNVFAHHVAWYLAYGVWAKDKLIDHIDGNSGNNKLNNLREATPAQNAHNMGKTRKKTSSKYKGVSLEKGRWRVVVKKETVGRYPTEEEAARAYDERAREVFGEYARCNFGENSAIRKPEPDM